jgi:hypothetical protein
MSVPRPDLGLEYEALLAAQGVVNTLSDDVPAAQLAVHDEIAAVAKRTGLPFLAAAHHCGKPVPTVSLCIALMGYLMHWQDMGWTALPGLADHLQTEVEVQQEHADERLALLALVAAALLPFAQARGEDLNVPRIARCAECAEYWSLLAEALHAMRQHGRAAECALVAARLLRRAGDEGAAAAGAYAVRLLHASKRSAAPVFTPRAKFPPRPQPTLSGDAARETLGQLLQWFFVPDDGAAFPAADLDAALQQMLVDKDFVLHQELVRFALLHEDGTEEPLSVKHVELRVAAATLLRMQARGRRSGRTLLEQVGQLASLLVDHQAALFAWRDVHQHEWFEYVQPRASQGLAGAVACVQSVADRALIILAEREQDVDAWLLYEQHGPAARDYLRRVRSLLA